jgi:hypothetical protein
VKSLAWSGGAETTGFAIIEFLRLNSSVIGQEEVAILGVEEVAGRWHAAAWQ